MRLLGALGSALCIGMLAAPAAGQCEDCYQCLQLRPRGWGVTAACCVDGGQCDRYAEDEDCWLVKDNIGNCREVYNIWDGDYTCGGDAPCSGGSGGTGGSGGGSGGGEPCVNDGSGCPVSCFTCTTPWF